jgi:hypothetical protein
MVDQPMTPSEKAREGAANVVLDKSWTDIHEHENGDFWVLLGDPDHLQTLIAAEIERQVAAAIAAECKPEPCGHPAACQREPKEGEGAWYCGWCEGEALAKYGGSQVTRDACAKIVEGFCVCDDGYTSRAMEDPRCPAHDAAKAIRRCLELPQTPAEGGPTA